VDSLLAQTYRDFEVIIVDDGSEDKTEHIINTFKKTDSRIRSIRHPSCKGANAARNTGIRAAEGQYVAFQDSDDEWFPQKLAVQIEAIQRTGVQAAFTSFWRIKGEIRTHIPKKNRQINPGAHSFHQELLQGNFIALPTFLVDKSLLNRVGCFDEKLSRLQDWELFLRLSQITQFIFINQPLVNAYLGSDNITEKKWLYCSALEFIIEKHREDFEGHPIALVTQYLNLAVDAIKRRNIIKTSAYLYYAFRQGIKPVAIVVTRKMLSGAF
jgi:glycosyltransferase involved in cell wall biosynthesis